MSELRVWTDGSHRTDCHCGGWAWATRDRSNFGSEGDASNNRMELLAIQEAIKANYSHDGLLVVITDCQLAVDLFTSNHWRTLMKRHWRTHDGKQLRDRVLVKAIGSLISLRRDEVGWPVEFRKVKGHSGDPMNDRVDGLASHARKRHHESRQSEATR